jgi:hypothetical protein
LGLGGVAPPGGPRGAGHDHRYPFSTGAPTREPYSVQDPS